jgi:hypothetical protein
MFELLPIEILHIVLGLSIGKCYLSLLRLNKYMYAAVHPTLRSFFEDHCYIRYRITDTFIICGGASDLRNEFIRQIFGFGPMRLELHHSCLPIIVTLVDYEYRNRRLATRIADCYIHIGTYMMTLAVNSETVWTDNIVQHTARFVWKRYIPYRPYHSRMIGFIMRYLPDLYAFLTVPQRLPDGWFHQERS